FKIIKKKFYESVIPRLDRGIQLFERGCRWFPRSSRGMTVDSLVYSVFKIIKKKFYESVIPRLDRGIQLFERGCRWFPRSSRGMTVDDSLHKFFFSKYC
ncbi:MAG: hypothetical protein HYW48_00305, partial [Deltaproteobacteria bacterium]|nr:hypothetical protein [Deltaproteobacteria bacterium]